MIPYEQMMFMAIDQSAAVDMLSRLRQVTIDPATVERFETLQPAAAVGNPLNVIGRTALIPINGVMLKEAGILSLFGFTSIRAAQRQVERAAADEDVEQIMLIIDSPGGSVGGLQELADAVFEARKQKPVIAQVDGMAASAAYFVASQATEVRAGQDALVGSIGVYLVVEDWTGLLDEVGVKFHFIRTGEFKAAGDPFLGVTESQLEYFQGIVDGFFEDFLAAVKRGRGMNVKDVKKSADGRVFLARESLERGLIDKVQSPTAALAQLREREAGRERSRRARLAGARLRLPA